MVRLGRVGGILLHGHGCMASFLQIIYVPFQFLLGDLFCFCTNSASPRVSPETVAESELQFGQDHITVSVACVLQLALAIVDSS